MPPICQHFENLSLSNYHYHLEPVILLLGKYFTIHFSHEIFTYVKSQSTSLTPLAIASPVKGIKQMGQLLFFDMTSRILYIN